VEQHGLPFEFYQATSSNSEDWKLPSTWSETAYASTNGATGADKATFAQRLASLLHRVPRRLRNPIVDSENRRGTKATAYRS